MGNALTAPRKREIARELYLHGDYTFEEIAAKVESTRQSVARWAKEGSWADIKASMTVGKEKTLKNLYAHVQRINDAILARPEGDRAPTPAEADTLAKLAAAVAKMETEGGIRECVGAGMAFIGWLRAADPGKAVEFAELWDSFIKSRLGARA